MGECSHYTFLNCHQILHHRREAVFLLFRFFFFQLFVFFRGGTTFYKCNTPCLKMSGSSFLSFRLVRRKSVCVCVCVCVCVRVLAPGVRAPSPEKKEKPPVCLVCFRRRSVGESGIRGAAAVDELAPPGGGTQVTCVVHRAAGSKFKKRRPSVISRDAASWQRGRVYKKASRRVC